MSGLGRLIGVSVLGIWTLVTHQRVATVWISDAALWAEARRLAPLKPRPAINFGRALELAGRLDDAIAQYQLATSLALDDRRSALHQRFALAAAETNIAHVEVRQGQLASAMRLLDGTLGWYPDWPYAHYNRGAILWGYGACEDGVKEMAVGWASDPALPAQTQPCGFMRPVEQP